MKLWGTDKAVFLASRSGDGSSDSVEVQERSHCAGRLDGSPHGTETEAEKRTSRQLNLPFNLQKWTKGSK